MFLAGSFVLREVVSQKQAEFAEICLTIWVDQNAPILSLACPQYALAAGTELTNHQASISIW